MKKLFLMATMTAAVMMIACGATKKPKSNAVAQSSNPFGDVWEVPAAEYDTDDYFGATGIAYGSKVQMGELQRIALANAQDIVRQKMKHAYKGALDGYMNTVANNVGRDIESKLEGGGTQLIDAIVNDTQASKGPMFSSVDEKGNVTCYIGIRVSKKVVAEAIADYVSEDDELKIRFKEDQFRQRMKESFREFKESK